MYYIREVVKHALETGYLSIESEESLRRLLGKQYSDEDLDAFVQLQEAVIGGEVKQQSRESIHCLTT